MERKRTDSWEEVRSGIGSFVSGLSIYGSGRRKSRGEIIDNIGKDNEVKAKIEAEISYNCKVIAGKTISRRDARASRSTQREGYKSERGMPRLQEARKDAASCEKARGSASMM